MCGGGVVRGRKQCEKRKILHNILLFQEGLVFSSRFAQQCIVHLVMIIVYNIHNSDNLHMQLQFQIPSWFWHKFHLMASEDWFFMSLPIYPYATSLLSIGAQLLIRGRVMHQCQTMQIHVSQLYLSSHVPDDFLVFLAQHRQSKLIIQIKTVIIF